MKRRLPHYATIGGSRLGVAGGAIAALLDLWGHAGHGAAWDHRTLSAVLLFWTVWWLTKSFIGEDVIIYVPRTKSVKTHVTISSRGATSEVRTEDPV